MPPRNITACQEQGRDAEQRRQRRAVAKRLLVAAWLAAGALGQLAEAKRQEIARVAAARAEAAIGAGKGYLSGVRCGRIDARSPLCGGKSGADLTVPNYFRPRIKTTSCIILSP